MHKHRLTLISLMAFMLLLLFVKPPVRAAGTELLARVNNEPVTDTELQQLLAEPYLRWQLEQALQETDPDGQALRRLAVRKLIHRHLLLQEADRQNITVTNQQLDHSLSALRDRFKDLHSFGAWMKTRGLNDRQLLESLRANLLVTRVIQRLLPEIEITEQQIQNFYRSHQDDLTLGEEVRLRIIVVNSEAAAQEVLAALRQGENFSRLAQTRSLGRRAAQGGDTGWVNTRMLSPTLRRVVDRLKPADASMPLQRTPDEFLIVALQERRLAQATELDEARPEIAQRLLMAQQQEIIQTWLTEQEQAAKIELFTQTGESQEGSGTPQIDEAETVLSTY